MFKKDTIFWIATCIFIAGIAAFGVTQNQLWLFMLIGSYLLRPTLASLKFEKAAIDERQMTIQYRSGNISFAVMIIACIAMAVYESNKNDHSWEFFNAVVIIGLTAKALSNVFLVGNYREAARKIIIGVGLMLVLFVSLENGFTIGAIIEALPFLGIVGVGWLSKKYPRTIGGVILGVALCLLFAILHKGFIIGQIITAIVVSTPLFIAGICFFVDDRIDSDIEDDFPVATNTEQ